jgi:hypothetical protein
MSSFYTLNVQPSARVSTGSTNGYIYIYYSDFKQITHSERGGALYLYYFKELYCCFCGFYHCSSTVPMVALYI